MWTALDQISRVNGLWTKDKMLDLQHSHPCSPPHVRPYGVIQWPHITWWHFGGGESFYQVHHTPNPYIHSCLTYNHEFWRGIPPRNGKVFYHVDHDHTSNPRWRLILSRYLTLEPYDTQQQICTVRRTRFPPCHVQGLRVDHRECTAQPLWENVFTRATFYPVSQ